MIAEVRQFEAMERVIANNIPSELAAQRQWLVWRYDQRAADKKPTKVPYQVNGSHASSVDPSHWVTFSEALAELYENESQWNGLGFVFTPEDEFIGIDLDDCLDGDGKPLAWAKEIVDGFATYSEVSPSGTGLKLFFRGEFPLDRGRKIKREDGGAIEVYTKGRYFTVTGNRFGDQCELATVESSTLASFADHYFTPVNKPELQPIQYQEPTASNRPDIVSRAHKYALAYPPAISGQGGHDTTFRLACVLVNGFELDQATALTILQGWNLGCQPAWSAKELEHKIKSAASVGASGDRGYMLTEPWPKIADGVNTLAIEKQLENHEPQKTLERVDVNDSAEDEAESIGDYCETFPSELLTVPGFVGEVADWITTQNPRPNPVLSLVAAIALQAKLIGRKVKCRNGQRSNLYLVALAPSGGGKQAPQDCIENILSLSGQSNGYSGKVSSDSAIAEALVESPSLLLVWDEFGRFLNSTKEQKGGMHMHAVQAVLLELWNKTGVFWKHKTMADRRANREIDQPCLNLLGLSVGSNFWSALEEVHMTDGFAARMLVFDSGDKASSREIEETKPPASILDVANYWRDYRPGGNLSSEHPEPTIVPETEEAKAIFQELTDYQETFTEEPAASVWSRAIEKSKRLALIYACSRDHENPVIDADAAKWGVAVAKWATSHFLKHAKDEVTPDDEFNRRVKKVFKYIKKRCKAKKVATWTVMLKSTRIPSGGPLGLQAIVSHLLETKQIEEVETNLSGKDKIGYRIVKGT